MRRFRFRLESLRRLAQAKERLERQRVAQQEKARGDAIARLEDEQAGADEARGAFGELLQTTDLPPAEVLAALRRIEDASERTRHAAEDLATEHERADTARAALVERMSERRSFDRLRERQQERHQKETDRNEDKEMDDAVNRRREEPDS